MTNERNRRPLSDFSFDENGIDDRVSDLIERGLERYGGGDLRGAMSEWEHALALDPDNDRAREFVDYVLRHFDSMESSIQETRAVVAEASCELDLPFGLEELPGAASGQGPSYEALEIAPFDGGDVLADNPVARISSESDLDDGWSLDSDQLEAITESASMLAVDGDATMRMPADQLGNIVVSERRLRLGTDSEEIELDGAMRDDLADLAAGLERVGGEQGGQHSGAAVNIDPVTGLPAQERPTVELMADEQNRLAAVAGQFEEQPTADVQTHVDQLRREDPGLGPEVARAGSDGGYQEDDLLELELGPAAGNQMDVAPPKAEPSALEIEAIEPAPEPPLTLDEQDEPAQSRTGSSLANTAAGAELLAELDRAVPNGLSDSEKIFARVNFLLSRASAECQRGNLELAAAAVDLALDEEPESAVAQKLVHERRDLILSVYRAYLGDSSAIPTLSRPMHELSLQDLDHRAAFLLSRIDGALNVEDILDVSGMSQVEAYQILCQLLMRGILQVQP